MMLFNWFVYLSILSDCVNFDFVSVCLFVCVFVCLPVTLLVSALSFQCVDVFVLFECRTWQETKYKAMYVIPGSNSRDPVAAPIVNQRLGDSLRQET